MQNLSRSSWFGENWIILASYAAVIAAILVAYFAVSDEVDPVPPLTDFSKFALFYIMTQAIERMLEPVTKFTDRLKHETVLKSEQPQGGEGFTEVDAEIEAIRAKTRAVLWAAASVIAMLASALLDLHLLQTVGATNAPPWLDVVVTGLAVGAGTQPLHELINRIEKKPTSALTK